MQCVICGKIAPFKDYSTKHNSCSGFCNWVVTKYGVFLPNGKIEITKPIELLKEKYKEIQQKTNLRYLQKTRL